MVLLTSMLGATHRTDTVDALKHLAAMRMIKADHVICVEPGAQSGDAAKITCAGPDVCIMGMKPGTSPTFEDALSRMHCGVACSV